MPVTGQGGGTAHRRHMRAAAGRPLIKIKVQASRDPSCHPCWFLPPRRLPAHSLWAPVTVSQAGRVISVP